jgi:hypothetical protein
MTGRDRWDRRSETGKRWQDSHDRTAGHLARQPGQDSSDWSVRTGQLDRAAGHVSLDKTERRGCPEHDSKDRKARTGQPGQESLDRITVAGRPGQDSWDRTSGTSQPGQVSLKNQAEQVRLDRSEWTDREDRTART